MSLRDFVDERRTVRHAGHIIVCGPPTVETVFRFVSLYPNEIAACRDALAVAGKDDPVDRLFPAFIRKGNPRAGIVLATCCSLFPEASHPPDELERVLLDAEPEFVSAIASAVIALTDPDKIAASITLNDDDDGDADATDPDDELGSDDKPSIQELSMVGLAQRFSLDPGSIMRWPYLRWQRVMKILDPGDDSTPGTWLTADMPGIVVGDTRNDG